PQSGIDEPAQHEGPAPDPRGLASLGVRNHGLGHPGAVGGDHEPDHAEEPPCDGVTVNIAQLAREGRAERQGDHATGPGETVADFLVHRAVSFLGSGASAPRPNEWTKPSSTSSSTESFR